MNAFDLYATLSLATEAYEQGLKDAESKGKSAAESIAGSANSGFSKFSGVMGKVGKATVAGFAAAGAGVAALTKQSVDAYGQYQQLVGGIETLYGDAAGSIMDYASEAYTSAGMSQNEYMEVSIQGSAAMLKALKEADEQAKNSSFIPDPSKLQQGIESTESLQQRAADLTNMSITDMSDNVNKMGTTMEAVQNAYRGFSRGNYTMLDNLALGYSGTKEGMEELLADAEALSGVHYEVGNYADMVQAIHVIQQDMGITGTTASEAAGTLTGSMASLTAAWQNLVTGLANGDADLGTLVSNVVEQAKGVIGNIMPIITQALTGIGELIVQLAPVLAEELPKLIEQVLPNLLTAATSLFMGVVQALPSLFGILTTTLPNLLKEAIPSLLEAIPSLLESALQLISALAQGIGEALPVLIPAVIECIYSIIEILTRPENIEMMTMAAVSLFSGIISGIALAIPVIVEYLPTIIENCCAALRQSFPLLIEAVVLLIQNLGVTIYQKVSGIFGDSIGQVEEGLASIYDDFQTGVDTVLEVLKGFGDDIITGVTAIWEGVTGLFSSGMETAKTYVSEGLTNLSQLFSDIWETIKTTVSTGIEAVLGLFDFEWSLPDLKLPHLSVTGGESPYGIGGKGSLPSFSVEWYKKAYDDAYIMNSPTIFGLAGGKLMAGGEGNGSEAIVGTDLLVDMMRQAVAEGGTPTINVQVYVAGEETDAFVVQSNQRNALIGGGRA